MKNTPTPKGDRLSKVPMAQEAKDTFLRPMPLGEKWENHAWGALTLTVIGVGCLAAGAFLDWRLTEEAQHRA